MLARFIAVTGHRHVRPSDLPVINARINEVLAELRTLEPRSPLVVLSALADGADRIVAEAVLAAGGELIVPLPMPREEYEQTFESDESRKEFAALLKRAKRWFELPLPPGVSHEQLRGDAHLRDRQYSALGRFLVTHCHVLIALWDGVASASEGGTADVVRYRLDGIPVAASSITSSLDRVGMGIVYHIGAPRVANAEPILQPGELFRLFPGSPEDQEFYHDAFESAAESLRDYQSDALRLSQSQAATPSMTRNGFVPPDVSTVPPIAILSDHFAVADGLALEFQRLTRRTLRGLICLAFIAALCMQFQNRVGRYHAALVTGYLVALIGAWVWHAVFQKRRHETKALEYRALAEGLRVQTFWELSGVRRPVADFYLHYQQTELQWIRDALRSAYIQSLTTRPGAPLLDDLPDAKRVAVVLQHWIKPQLEYYLKTAATNQRIDRRLGYVMRGFLAISIVLAVARLATAADHAVFSALGSAAAIAALLQLYRRNRAYEELGRHYERMGSRFQYAERELVRLAEDGLKEDPRDLLFSLGVEALRENGDWVLLRRDRPLKALLPKLR